MATTKKAGSGLGTLVKPDAVLGAIVGTAPISRMDITKKIWVYIKKNGLQDGRTILASKDAKLSAFLGKKDVQMFAIAKAVSNHLA